MVVLSLFNGMSCGYMALQEAGIPVTKYYSSEVDKHAVSMSNILYPDTIQLGDVRNINVNELDKIDILIGGSPCQSFSFAGKMKGMSTKCEKEILSLEQYLEMKEQNFEFEGQSYLFWEYVRIYTELRLINPDIKFFLENVLMVEKWERLISKTLDVNPIMINSALLSAQNRKRLYWTNIGMAPAGLFGKMASIIKQPDDKGILLKDILEENVADKYYLSEKALCRIERKNGFTPQINPEKNGCINTKNNSGQLSVDNGTTLIKVDKNLNPKKNQDKASCFTAGGNSGGNHSDMDLICVAMRGRNPENPKSRKSGLPTEQMIEPRHDGKTNCLTSVQKDNLVFIKTENYIKWNGSGFDQDNRAYYLRSKSGNLDTKPQRQKVLLNNDVPYKIRRLTPRECGRLQTVPEHLLDKMLSSGINDTQLYKMFGNGWTVSVIAHIFSYLIHYQKDKIIAE